MKTTQTLYTSIQNASDDLKVSNGQEGNRRRRALPESES